MARVAVIAGMPCKTLHVDGLPFLPGLVFHRSLEDKSNKNKTYSITHTRSGLALITNVEEKLLELIRMILGRVDWEKSATEIFYLNQYAVAIEEALAVIPDKSKKQETRLAEELEGKRQPASGARWGYRRDVITPHLLVEAKTTERAQHSVPYKDLRFLRLQAYTQGKVPAYIVQIGKMEEVVFMPLQELGPNWEEEFGEVKTIESKKRKKSVPVTKALVTWLRAGNAMIVPFDPSDLVIISYEKFLLYAKRGL
jgi:hypothetical protein